MNEIPTSHREGRSDSRRVLVAVSIGNMLEWYDFAVYGFLTPVIAKIMFPAADPTASLLLSAGAFGVGFMTRPVGALVFGALADRTNIIYVYQICAFLPLIGLLTGFLPDIGGKRNKIRVPAD